MIVFLLFQLDGFGQVPNIGNFLHESFFCFNDKGEQRMEELMSNCYKSAPFVSLDNGYASCRLDK